MVGDRAKDPKKLKRVKVVFRLDPLTVKQVLTEEGFEVVDKNPDFVVCYGGDGTVLYGEREYPQVPKLILKTSRICRPYDYKPEKLRKYLNQIKSGAYQIYSEMKLEATAKGKKLVGLNEIQIHLKLPIYAVRFSFSVNGTKYDELIGDGVIVSTPFGATGYYQATGGEFFEKGIGISFNNLHNKIESCLVVPKDSVIGLTVTRGPAWLLADNNEDFIALDAGDSVKIKKSESMANFIYFS